MPISNACIRSALIAAFGAAAVILLNSSGMLAETVPVPQSKPQPAAPAQSPPSQSTMSAIIARQDWQAKPPLFAMKAHLPMNILVHHTAGPVNTKRDIHYKMRSLQAYSQKPAALGNSRKRSAWADVPYHFYIAADGMVAEGRDIMFSGDTNTNYDPAGHIQVVLEGNFENTVPAPAQLAALETLLVSLATKWQVPAARIRAHKQMAATLCPGRNLLSIFPQLKQRIAARLK